MPTISSSEQDIPAEPTHGELSRIFLRLWIIAIVVTSLAGLMIIFSAMPGQASRALGPACMLPVALIARVLLARNQVRACIFVLLIGTWTVITGICFFNGGLRATLIVAYPVIILISGWLLGQRFAFAIASLTVVTTLGFMLAENQGLLPAMRPTPLLLYWVLQAITFMLSAILISYLVRSFQKRILEAQQLNRDLARLTTEAAIAQAVRRSSSLLEQTGKIAKVGGWELDLPSGLLTWTPEVFRILELEPGTAPPLEGALAFYAPEARPVIESAIQATIAHGCSFDQVQPLVTAQGRTIWVRTLGEAQFEQGKVVRITGALQDISEQMQSAAQLKRSVDNLERTLEATGEGIFAYDGRDPTGRLLFANELFFRIWNIPAEDAPATGRPEIIAAARKLFIDPDAEVQRIIDILAGPEIHEDHVYLNDGRVLFRRSIPIAGHNGVSRVWSFRDVTREKNALAALRESEEQLNQAQEIARVGSFEWNPMSSALHWSDQHFRLWGLAPRSLPESLALFRQGIHPEDVARVDAVLAMALAGECHYECQHRVIWPDGSEHSIHGRGEVLFDEAGQAIRMIGTVQDITERVAISQALIKARDEAECANHAKTAFLANMSHELRTPMSAILGMNGLALRRASDPVLHDYLSKVDTASKHLLGVINDILDISKIEAGHLKIEQIPFEFEKVFQNLGVILGPRISEKGLKLDIRLGTELMQRRYLGDPLRLGQILLNLAGNAVKFSEQGSIAISAQRINEDSDHVVLRFEIEDSGIGISDQDQQRLFIAFEQADGSTSRKYGGTGLGLSISKRLVKLMDGEIGVKSKPGIGSIFWFTARFGKVLPVSQSGHPISPDLPENAPESSAELQREMLQARYAGTRILLAEDDRINQEIALYVLEEAGFVVDLAEDGEAAVAMASATPYPLILMDIQMPRLNGIDACRKIRALPGRSQVPILAMTANAFAEDRQACIDAGMNDHIGKPVDADLLYATLFKWLSR